MGETTNFTNLTNSVNTLGRRTTSYWAGFFGLSPACVAGGGRVRIVAAEFANRRLPVSPLTSEAPLCEWREKVVHVYLV